MDPSMFFSGSSAIQYKPTRHYEAGIGYSWLNSISAMRPYETLSFEEIRMEDYKAAGGLFGSKLAKLAGAVCVRPGKKLNPYQYGMLYQEIVSPIFNHKVEDSKIVPSAAAPLAQFDTEKHIQRPNINLTFHGKPNVTVLIQTPSDVNFSFKDSLAVKSTGQAAEPVQKPTLCDQSQAQNRKKRDSSREEKSKAKSHEKVHDRHHKK